MRPHTRPSSRRRCVAASVGCGLARLVALLIVAGASIGCGQEPEVRPTNILLISLDTLREDHLGCYGYERPTSTRLDSLAAEGSLFDNCAATSPRTLPSHASMFTGLYPSRHGLQSYPHPNGEHRMLPETCTTLAQVLKMRGFKTAAIVNSRWVSREFGLDRGFDHFEYVQERGDQEEPSDVTDKSLAWLSTVGEKRFFLFLHWYDLHSDYASLPEFERDFVGPYGGRADGTTDQLRNVNRGREPPFDDRDIKHLKDLCDASICQLDQKIGRVIDHVESLGLLDKTLIIVTSDHGEGFLEHGHLLHGKWHHQEVIHVPLIVRGPGIPSNRRIKHVVSLVDIMPTVLAALAIEPPSLTDGVDLCPTLQDRTPNPPHLAVFTSADHWNSAVTARDAQHKLYYNRWTHNTKVYDLIEDPGELRAIEGTPTPAITALNDLVSQFIQTEAPDAASGRMTTQSIEQLKSLGYVW